MLSTGVCQGDLGENQLKNHTPLHKDLPGHDCQSRLPRPGVDVFDESNLP